MYLTGAPAILFTTRKDLRMPFDRDVAKLTVELSRLAYKDAAAASAGAGAKGLGEFKFYDGGNSTQAFVATTATDRYLAFRGTESNNARDWVADAKFSPQSGALGQVHSGFNEALDEIWGDVATDLAGDARPLTITGHSLGGGLAILAAARLIDAGSSPVAVYVYGCPRPGLRGFRDAYDTTLKNLTHRVINHIDIVTRVPLLSQGYRAPGLRQYFDKSGTFHENAGAWQIIKEDLKYRLTNFKSINALGLGSHEIGAYIARVNSL